MRGVTRKRKKVVKFDLGKHDDDVTFWKRQQIQFSYFFLFLFLGKQKIEKSFQSEMLSTNHVFPKNIQVCAICVYTLCTKKMQNFADTLTETSS